MRDPIFSKIYGWVQLSPAELAEWEDQYKAIKPLETELAPPLKRVEELTFDECQAENDKIYREMIHLHALPRIEKLRPDEYLRTTFELLRKRCNQLHWRMIELKR